MMYINHRAQPGDDPDTQKFRVYGNRRHPDPDGKTDLGPCVKFFFKLNF